MKIIATIPPPHNPDAFFVARHPLVSAARFNTGSHGKSSYSPLTNLEMLQRAMGRKKLYVDLKCRQLRVRSWADPNYGVICLNRKVEVDVPAELWLRGEENPLVIFKVQGSMVYTETNPKYATGRGQAANIIGQNLKISGSVLTRLDCEYIKAAIQLGMHDYWLSDVESNYDIEQVLERDSDARIWIKIETSKGVEYILSPDFEKFKPQVNVVAARDDLFIEMQRRSEIFSVLKKIVEIDPEAIVASRLLDSLLCSDFVSLSDLADIHLMELFGYRNFMLSDRICENRKSFNRVMEFFQTRQGET